MKNTELLIAKFIGISLLICMVSQAFSQTGNLKAMNDTIDLYPGVPVVYNILANDTIPANDTLRRVIGGGANHVQCQIIHGSTWVFTFKVPSWGVEGEVQGAYMLMTMSMDTSNAKILFRIHDKSFSYLDINNVRARFTASGIHFFYENAEFEVPKGSGKTSIFSNSLWIGGLDGLDSLHFAGERYRQGPGSGQAGTHPDFYAGPVMDPANYSIYQDTVWNYIWNLKKSEIDFHRAHYWKKGYVAIHDILTWPGNGNVALGQAEKLAPFSDRNGNGIYEPYDGDYPEIRGDQCLFFIFNDDRDVHQESAGEKLRVEIHGMAYAWDLPNDSAFKNTVFLSYKLFNRSQNTYNNVFLGVFTDIDLGYPNDDYIGCDVERNMYFGYNGTPVDGTGQSYAYGANPPVQSVILLAGPLMDADGIDNPRYDNEGHQLCDVSVNGIYFGDNIVDNERFGMRKFVYINNSNAGVPNYMTDPVYAPDYYHTLLGIWKDGSRMIYGGNGHAMAGGYGPECNFMFPGMSDTLNWGVGCVPPNGPVYWTDSTAMNNPQDRRGIGSTGPFTFKPGDSQELDIAFAWARDYSGKSVQGSIGKLRQVTDVVNKSFVSNTLPNGNLFAGILDKTGNEPLPFNIYPNPAFSQVSIAFSPGMVTNATVELISIQGQTLRINEKPDNQNRIAMDVTGLARGFYFIRVSTKDQVVIKKILIVQP